MKRESNAVAKKIWIQHHGKIPKDNAGRSYEIHHLDGDHTNNDISNLKVITIQEHYDIHHSQGDWGACSLIAKRMKLSPEELSALATAHNKAMIANGTHPWLRRADGSSVASDLAKRLVEEGTHNFIGSPYAAKMYAEGTHPFLGGEIQRATNTRRVNDGSHNFIGDKNPSHDRVKKGTHHMQGSTLNLDRLSKGTHVSQLKVSCIHCRKELDKANFSRSHGDKCKLK